MQGPLVSCIFRSCKIIFDNVIRGRPRGSSSCRGEKLFKIFSASASSGIHAMCSNKKRRLDWTMAERWGCLDVRLASSFRTCWYYFALAGTTHQPCIIRYNRSWDHIDRPTRKEIIMATNTNMKYTYKKQVVTTHIHIPVHVLWNEIKDFLACFSSTFTRKHALTRFMALFKYHKRTHELWASKELMGPQHFDCHPKLYTKKTEALTSMFISQVLPLIACMNPPNQTPYLWKSAEITKENKPKNMHVNLFAFQSWSDALGTVAGCILVGRVLQSMHCTVAVKRRCVEQSKSSVKRKQKRTVTITMGYDTTSGQTNSIHSMLYTFCSLIIVLMLFYIIFCTLLF